MPCCLAKARMSFTEDGQTGLSAIVLSIGLPFKAEARDLEGSLAHQTARFVFSGRLLDMDRGEDLTDKRLKDLRRIAFDSLPLDKAVKTVYGNGKRKLAVFTDVDCPFSRKLGTTLESLKDVTVYTFLFPLESIHPEARGKSDAIWCAKDHFFTDGGFKDACQRRQPIRKNFSLGITGLEVLRGSLQLVGLAGD